jgi:hypothetical protein
MLRETAIIRMITGPANRVLAQREPSGRASQTTGLAELSAFG